MVILHLYKLTKVVYVLAAEENRLFLLTVALAVTKLAIELLLWLPEEA